MKYLTISIITLAMLSIWSTNLSAQRGGRDSSPEQRAEQESALMRDSLGLSDAQYNKVYEINLDYAKKMQELRNNAEGDWSSMREAFAALRQEQNEALKKVLTTEQYEKWQRIQRQRMDRRPGQGRQRRGDGPPPSNNGGN